MQEILPVPAAIVRSHRRSEEIGARIEHIAKHIAALKKTRGKLRNLLSPEECKARSGGATAGFYAQELNILERMAADKDMSFENWKKHGGRADEGPFFDEKSDWDFFTWRFGTHMEKRDNLKEAIDRIDANMIILREEYRTLIALVRRS